MAAVTTAVVAGVSAAYTIASSEQQKNQARKAGQKADRDAANLTKENDDEKQRAEATKSRDMALNRQKKLARNAQAKEGATLATGDVASGGDVGSNTTLGGGAGKTLLGV